MNYSWVCSSHEAIVWCACVMDYLYDIYLYYMILFCKEGKQCKSSAKHLYCLCFMEESKTNRIWGWVNSRVILFFFFDGYNSCLEGEKHNCDEIEIYDF